MKAEGTNFELGEAYVYLPAEKLYALQCRIKALEKIVKVVKKAIANTPHTNECTYYKNVGIDCKCWQREVAEAMDELDGEK